MRTRRIEWVDAVRGYALLAIMLNHFHQAAAEIGARGTFSLTLTQLGLSSAAELFVICAGFGMGKALAAIENRQGAGRALYWLGRRMLLIYGANLLSFLASVACILLLIAPAHRTGSLFIFANGFEQAPLAEALNFMAFGSPATLFVILNFYLLLLPVIWCQFQLLKYSPRLAVALSLALYALTQTPWFPPPTATDGFAFQVSSWQILGLAGLILARVESDLPQTFSRGRFLLLCGMFLAFLPLKAAWFLSGADWPWFEALRGKDCLGPLRALHALLTMLMLREAFLGLARYPHMQAAAVASLGLLGRYSLTVFSAQNVVIYLGAAIILLAGAHIAAYWGIYLAILAATGAFALYVPLQAGDRKLDIKSAT